MNNLINNRKFYIFYVVLIFFASRLSAQPLDWDGLGSYSTGFGTNGTVFALEVYNGNLIAAGSFSQAGGVNVSNIALWNGLNWAPLGLGLNDTVYALAVYNGNLYAGGYFTQAGGNQANHIARWNGSVWQGIGSGVNDEVDALEIYNGWLYMGGKFSYYGQNICAFDGNNWYQLGQGTDDDVFALTVYNGNLIVGGKFNNAGGMPASKIARWNGSAWSPLSSYTDERIHALGLYNSSVLIAGGRFTTIGGVSANHVASWNGSNWSPIGGGVDDYVYAVTSYRGSLIVGGQFRFAGNDTLYVDRTAQWDGLSWSRMITGASNKVCAFTIKDTNLFVGGQFIYAGGKITNRVAEWGRQVTRTVSGTVRYNDNFQPVPSGNVRAYRMDLNSRELILEDSGRVVNGTYMLPRVRIDSMFIISFPDDELQDFVPTLHPSTIDWATAVRIYPITNLTNVDVNVYRIAPGPHNNQLVSVGGHVYLNYMPPFFNPNPLPPLPFKSDAIIYVKSGGQYKQFTVSSQLEQYALLNVAPGNYDVYVNRIGYTSASRSIVVGSVNIDTLNFYLDTTSLIGIQNISSEVPKNFELNQNYPNPFNPVTKIQFALAKPGHVRLSVYNILGQEVGVLADENLGAGRYEVTFNALRLTSGIYFYKLTSDNYSETKKMVLLK